MTESLKTDLRESRLSDEKDIGNTMAWVAIPHNDSRFLQLPCGTVVASSQLIQPVLAA